MGRCFSVPACNQGRREHASQSTANRATEIYAMVAMITIRGDLQPGRLADRLLSGLFQPQIYSLQCTGGGLQPGCLVKVKVYTGSHQRALRKGSQLVLALARAPPKDKKEKQQRLMRIRRVVSHAIRPAPSPPEASRSTSNLPSRSPIITVAVVKVYFVSCFCDLI